MHANDEWFEETFRQIHKDIVGGLSRKEAKEAFAWAYQAAIESGEITREALNVFDEGLSVFERKEPKVHARRRKEIIRNLRYFTNKTYRNEFSLLYGTQWILTDNLNEVYPVGTQDGRTKCLAYWTIEDFEWSVEIRRQKGIEILNAASDLGDEVGIIKRRMKEEKAHYFKEVNW